MSTFTAPVWLWEGNAAWHFVTLPEELSDEIEARTAHRSAGFGSVRVEVTIGETTWRTSVFPDKTRGAYVLPLKAAVRTAEQFGVGDQVTVDIEVVTDAD